VKGTNLDFNNNHSQEGGALTIHQGSQITISDSFFTQNHAFEGGMLIASDSAITLTNVDISMNEAARGSAFYLSDMGNDVFLVVNSKIHDN
jgi:hypothetical protein